MNKISKFIDHVNVLSSSEIFHIKKCVEEQIYKNSGRKTDSVENYHLTHNDLHYIFSKKSAREFTINQVESILNLPGLLFLQNKFSNYQISDVVDEKGIHHRPEIYFRLVRPHAKYDVGIPHRDSWFHELAGLKFKPETTWKIWLAICVESGLNGLEFFPDVNIHELHWDLTDGKIVCPRNQSALGFPLFPNVSPGDALIFRDDIIHSGIVNTGCNTRCSIEITFVPKGLNEPN